MSVSAIYASKLYRASTRKEKIRAALADPINMELVQQLEEYIDEPEDEVLEPARDVKVSKNVEHKPVDVKTGDADTQPEEFDNSELPEEIVDDIPSSMQVKKELVSASVKPYSHVSGVQLEGLADELKGTLNVREGTLGVCRVQLKDKDNEVWIYYNDSVNLNNVMTSVIEVLNAADYNFLNFNRLARSDNAIVFELSIIDTENRVKTSKEVKDEE